MLGRFVGFGGVCAAAFALVFLASVMTPASGFVNVCEGVTDLSLTKTVDYADGNAVFTLTLTNSGPTQNAGGVVVKDQLPAGVTYLSHTVSRGTYDPLTGIWAQQKNIWVGEPATLQITAAIGALAINGATSTAELTAANQSDPDSTPDNHVPTEDDQSEAIISTSNSGGAIIQGGTTIPTDTPVPTDTPSPTPIITCTPTPVPTDSPTPTPVLGSITVCKAIVDPMGNVVDGSAVPGAQFTIGFFDPDPDPITSGPEGVPPDTNYTTAITFNTDTFLVMPVGSDSDCTIHRDLPLGDYYYRQEDFPNTGWQQPLYNDQKNTLITSLMDFFPYSDALFTADPGDDAGRNEDSDGHIELLPDRPDRTLVVLNEYEATMETPTPTPVTATPIPPCTPTPTPITATPIPSAVLGATATHRPTRTPGQPNPQNAQVMAFTPTPTATPVSVLGELCVTPSPTLTPITPTPTQVAGVTATARPTRTPRP
jgi:uncharacterized repeat protein (TIGR01451 family)